MVSQQFVVEGTTVNFSTRPDLFSPKGLDKGTQLLLESVSDERYTRALDWGCGWGAMGLWLAARNPQAHVTMLDSDMSAIKATRANIEANNLTNIELISSAGFEDLSTDTRYDLIVSHPPTHRGREVVESMIKESYIRLTATGSLVIVVEARLKPWVKQALEAESGSCTTLKQSHKHVVPRARAS